MWWIGRKAGVEAVPVSGSNVRGDIVLEMGRKCGTGLGTI